ncbi:uncharacterized protein [Anabrus simplex]|uniref:uncharacterized protein n=1 Tax=Anabrus simplex TaxID=316456 RepID=UPI0034DDC47C
MEGYMGSSVHFEGHPEGLLDRDQRTVSRGRFDDMTATRVLARSCGSSITTTTLSATTVSWNNKRRQHPTVRWSTIRRTLRRLGEALVIGVCVLSAVRLPPLAMAAPVDVRANSHPKWINPCGIGQTPNLPELDSEIASDYHSEELLDRILIQARTALMQAERFKEDYTLKTFKMGFSQFYELWKTNHYEWLPSSEEIPKDLGETMPQEHLDKLKLDMALRNVYQYLQRFAVGLEQVVWDQGEDGEFKSAFEDAELKLKATLCEVQVTMLESSVNQPEDIKRDIMGERYRVMNELSLRNLRDWLIFRDYMNGLEYVIQVFEHFKRK